MQKGQALREPTAHPRHRLLVAADWLAGSIHCQSDGEWPILELAPEDIVASQSKDAVVMFVACL